MPDLAELRSRCTGNLQHFFCFPKLPIELRLKIWLRTLPGPQVVELSFTTGQIGAPPSSNAINYHNHPGSSNPITLQICRESREEALRFYELCPDSYRYVDFRIDTIFIYTRGDHFWKWQCLDVFQYIFKKSLHKVQHLVVSFDICLHHNLLSSLLRQGRYKTYNEWQEKLEGMPGLQDLGILLTDDEMLMENYAKKRCRRSRGLVAASKAEHPVTFISTPGAYPELSYAERYGTIQALAVEFKSAKEAVGMAGRKSYIWKYVIVDI